MYLSYEASRVVYRIDVLHAQLKLNSSLTLSSATQSQPVAEDAMELRVKNIIAGESDRLHIIDMGG